jgi:hypothetical protein
VVPCMQCIDKDVERLRRQGWDQGYESDETLVGEEHWEGGYESDVDEDGDARR